MRTRSRGQAVVEFALAFPVLVLLVLAVFDAGRAVISASSIANAVRDGARAGTVLYPTTGWDGAAEAKARAAASALDPSQLSVTVVSDATASGTWVEVRATYGFRPIAPILTLGQTDFPLTATSRMLARQA